jgi:hypothetical protein
MAKRLEQKLYATAPSLDEYRNETSLKLRLQMIAQDMRPQLAPAPSQAPSPNPSPGAPPAPALAAAADPSPPPPPPAAAVPSNPAPQSMAPPASAGSMQPSHASSGQVPGASVQREQVLRQQQQRCASLSKRPPAQAE